MTSSANSTPNDNNPPEVVVELTRELATFLHEDYDNSIYVSLEYLQNMKADQQLAAEALVSVIEKYKAIRAAVKRGLDCS